MKKGFHLILVIALLFTTFGIYSLPASATDDNVWSFNTDNNFEGWTGFMRMDSRTVTGGYYSMNALGTLGSQSPAIYSPSTFTCPAASFPILKIKLKNSTASTSIGAYFTTTTDTNFSESKKVSFTITANSSDYIEYSCDMSTNTNWTGTFKQFMLAFGNVTGNLSIDSIKLDAPTVSQEWNFNDNTTNGWSAWGTHSASAASGNITVTRTGSGQGAVNSPSVSLDTTTYKYLTIGVNSTTASGLKFYFKCDANGFNETNTKTVAMTPSSTFNEYMIDFSTSTGWTGSFKQYMMILTTEGTASIDYIKLSNTYVPPVVQNGVNVSIAATADTITTIDGTTTLTATVTSNNTLNDYGVTWKTNNVNAILTKNTNGTATLTGKINGMIVVTAISKADKTAIATKTIAISNQDNKAAHYDLKVMLFGNSILKHGPNAGLGWSGNWGMAASSEDKDYVHRLMNYYVQNKYGTLDFSLYGIATFEQAIVAVDNYDYTSILAPVATAVASYLPNIVDLQLGENVSASGLTATQYANALEQLVQTIQTASPGVKIMLCTPFWGGTIKLQGLQSVATEYNLPISDLSTLNTDENKATGLFANSGVAAHPGDTGMEHIAGLIWANMDDVIMDNFPAQYEYLPQTITLTSPSDTITTDAGTVQMSASVLPAIAGQDVTWSVSNVDLATVGANGLLTAKNNGQVVVTATSTLNTVFGTKTITISGQSTPYTVTYLAGTTDSVTNLPTANNFAKGTFTLSTQKPLRTAYQFVGWSLTQNGAVVGTITITGNTSVYAVWKLASTWEFNENDNLQSITVQNGFNVFVLNGKLMAIATGTDVASGNVLRVTSPTLSLTTANYKALVLKLQNTAFNASTAINLVVHTTNGDKTYSAVVTSINDTQYGFDLSDCTGTITGFYFEPTNIDCTINVDYIRFASGIKVTYDANTTDTVTGLPTSEYVFDGTNFTVNTAQPTRVNYRFGGWSLTSDGTTPVASELTVTANTTLYAIWIYNVAWDFNTNGDFQGWTPGNLSNTSVTGGYLSATALNKGSEQTPSYDPIIAVTPALVSTNTYKKVKVRLSYTLLSGVTSTTFQVFFKSQAVTSLSEAASKSIVLSGNSSNGFIDVELDMSQNTLWSGSNLTYLRIDPISGGGTFQIDSIELLQ